jgi:outer membrane protein
MLKKLTLTVLLTISTLYADTIIGGEVSLGIYSHSPSGSASYAPPFITSDTTVDVEDDFGWSDEQDTVFKAYFEHPVPLFPNMRITYSNLSHSGQGTVDGFSWGDIIDIDGEIETSAEMKMYDLTLYYELLDNWVEIDAGVTFRYFDGNIAVNTLAKFSSFSTSVSSEVTNFDEYIPMLYGKTRFNIPTTDISLQFEGNAISYNDTTFYDYELSARYTFSMGLGIEGGYKTIHLESEALVDGLILDMDLSGPYASIVWDF